MLLLHSGAARAYELAADVLMMCPSVPEFVAQTQINLN